MEQWDIYDRQKRRTGRTMQRNDWRLKEGEYHLSVLGVIRRPDGKILITKRARDKEWAPGWWEVPGGGVLAGESSRQAVQREIREETGLDVSDAEGGFLFSYQRENLKEGDNYFVDIYRFTMDFTAEDVQIQEAEVDAFALADANTIAHYGKEGKFLHFDSIRQAFEA